MELEADVSQSLCNTHTVHCRHPWHRVIRDLQCKDMTHTWDWYQTSHSHYTECSFRHVATLKHSSQSLTVSRAAKTTVHTLSHLRCGSAAIHWVLQRAKEAMCACWTRPGSVKQWLKLNKRALALLPNCLPALWAWAWRGIIPWLGHWSHMLLCMYVCFLEVCLVLHSWSYITSVCGRLRRSVSPLTRTCCSFFVVA